MNMMTLIRRALKEDIGKGDITSNLIIPKDLSVEAEIIAKEDGVLAGGDVARLVFHLADKRVKFISRLKDGARLKKGDTIAILKGPARSILKAERTALNFLGHLCGVATLTSQFVSKVKGTNAKIMDTRKTTPLLRALEKRAVKTGGGFNHRMGLYDQVLVKDNHIKILKILNSKSEIPLGPEIFSGQGLNKSKIQILKQKRIKIEIEVKNLQELKEALKAGPDIIMLDNVNLGQIKEAVRLRGRRNIKLEASGGVNLKNVRTIAKTGVDMISIGALTHSAPTLDVSLEIIG